MKMMKLAIAAILVPTLVAIAAFAIIGPARIWAMFGPPDLGPVEFERLARRSTPNDALACPAGLCAARIDLEPPTYAVDAAALRAALAAVIAGEPKTERVAADDATLTDRYVQRTALMGFPDTIVVRALEQPGGRSTLAIYARSQLGRSDLGANRARIERWLAKLGDKVPIVR